MVIAGALMFSQSALAQSTGITPNYEEEAVEYPDPLENNIYGEFNYNSGFDSVVDYDPLKDYDPAFTLFGYHIKSSSEAIGEGDTNYTSINGEDLDFDYDDEERSQNSLVDVGADEYHF